MQRKLLLEQIWNNKVEVRLEKSVSPLASILELMLPETVISLAVSGGISAPYAVREDTELLPGVSLGDILEEELDIQVSQSALVIVEPVQHESAANSDSHELESTLRRIMAEIAPATCISNVRIHSKNPDVLDLAENARFASA